MNRRRHQLDEIGLGAVCVVRRYRERPTLLKQRRGKIFESTCNHQARVRQVETLRCRTWKIESLRHDHLARFLWEVERDVVTEHSQMIILGLA